MSSIDFDPQELVEHIDSFGHGLSDWEKARIIEWMENPPAEYSPKQIAIINRIYDEKC